MGEEFEVKIEDLNKGSHSIIKYICDYCGKEKEIDYKGYMNNKNKSYLKNDCCKDCLSIKNKESNLDRYGIASLSGTKEVIEKATKTNLQRYGYEHHSQSLIVKEKHKNTKIKRANKYIRINEEYAEILLPNDYITIIDLENVEMIKNYKWSRNANGYVNTKVDGKTIFLHRLITNCPDDMVIDHINHDILDNRKNNLRICTQQENTRNHRLHKDNSSGVNGISWYEKNGVWCGYIGVDYKTIYLGCSTNIEEVKEMREKADDLIFKEYKYNKENDRGEASI